MLCCRWLFGGRRSSSAACWTVWCLLYHHRFSTTNTTTPFYSRGSLEPASSSWRRNMWAPNNATPRQWRLLVACFTVMVLSSHRRSSSWETGFLKTEVVSWRSCRHCPPISTYGWSWRLASPSLSFPFVHLVECFKECWTNICTIGKNSLLQKRLVEFCFFTSTKLGFFCCCVSGLGKAACCFVGHTSLLGHAGEEKTTAGEGGGGGEGGERGRADGGIGSPQHFASGYQAHSAWLAGPDGPS